MNVCDEKLINILLYESSLFSYSQNHQIFNSSIRYIIDSNFVDPLQWIYFLVQELLVCMHMCINLYNSFANISLILVFLSLEKTLTIYNFIIQLFLALPSLLQQTVWLRSCNFFSFFLFFVQLLIILSMFSLSKKYNRCLIDITYIIYNNTVLQIRGYKH